MSNFETDRQENNIGQRLLLLLMQQSIPPLLRFFHFMLILQTQSPTRLKDQSKQHTLRNPSMKGLRQVIRLDIEVKIAPDSD